MPHSKRSSLISRSVSAYIHTYVCTCVQPPLPAGGSAAGLFPVNRVARTSGHHRTGRSSDPRRRGTGASPDDAMDAGVYVRPYVRTAIPFDYHIAQSRRPTCVARPHRSCMHARCSGPSMHAHDRARLRPTRLPAVARGGGAGIDASSPRTHQIKRECNRRYIHTAIRMYVPPSFDLRYSRERGAPLPPRAFEMTLSAWGRAVPVPDGSRDLTTPAPARSCPGGPGILSASFPESARGRRRIQAIRGKVRTCVWPYVCTYCVHTLAGEVPPARPCSLVLSY